MHYDITLNWTFICTSRRPFDTLSSGSDNYHFTHMRDSWSSTILIRNERLKSEFFGFNFYDLF